MENQGAIDAPVQAAFRTWESINLGLVDAIRNQAWELVPDLLERKSRCQAILEEGLPQPAGLSAEQRRRLESLLQQESALDAEIRRARELLESERQLADSVRNKSNQFRRSYGAKAPPEALWEHFT